MVLAECRAKHLKFTFCKSIEMQVLCFWCSTDSGGMPFQTFHVSNVLHFFVLAPHWTHLSIYMLVLPKKCLGSVCVGILHKIYEWELCFEYVYLGTYFQKICWCEYVLQMSYNRFLQGTFSVYIFMYTYFPTYFLWNILGHISKKVLEIQWLPWDVAKIL